MNIIIIIMQGIQFGGGACNFRADTNIQSRRGNTLMVFDNIIAKYYYLMQATLDTNILSITQDNFKLLSIQHTADSY